MICSTLCGAEETRLDAMLSTQWPLHLEVSERRFRVTLCFICKVFDDMETFVLLGSLRVEISSWSVDCGVGGGALQAGSINVRWGAAVSPGLLIAPSLFAEHHLD